MVMGDKARSTDNAYIGDGVYASFDGWHIKLTTEREGREEVIFLEPAVFNALAKFANACWNGGASK